MPLLSTSNCFSILSNTCDSEMTSSDIQNSEIILIPTHVPTAITPKVRKPKWEKALPKAFTISATEGNPTSLKLKVKLETTNTAEKISVTSLIDSGAMGEFIDQHYAKSCWFDLVKLAQPILVHNIDRTA